MAAESRTFGACAYAISGLDVTAVYAPIASPVMVAPACIHPVGLHCNPVSRIYTYSDIRSDGSVVKNVGGGKQPVDERTSSYILVWLFVRLVCKVVTTV